MTQTSEFHFDSKGTGMSFVGARLLPMYLNLNGEMTVHPADMEGNLDWE